LSAIYEQYMRCGSCRAFEVAFTDRVGRTMGQCIRRPQHGQLAASAMGCEDYLLDRSSLVPGAKVPDNIDMTPRQRERRRAIQRAMQQRARRPKSTSRRPKYEEPPKVKLRDIPLAFGDDEEGTMDRDELKGILAEVLDEALGISDAPMHPRFRGGKVVVQPGNPELSPKEIPIDALFRKITSVRDKLRVLEQKINTNKAMEADDRAQLQGYISSAYGSLTTFNFLFRDRDDGFSSK